MFAMYEVLVPGAIAAMRFAKWLPSHITVHKFAMVTAATVTLPAAAAALVASSNGLSQGHLWVGMAIAVLIATNVVLGVGLRQWLRSESQPPHYWIHVRRFHFYSGYLMAIFGMVNCHIGIELMFGATGRIFSLVYNFSLIAAFIAGLAWEEYGRTVSTAEARMAFDRHSAALATSVQSLSNAELRAQVRGGSKWVVIDGRVFDVGPFVKNHP